MLDPKKHEPPSSSEMLKASAEIGGEMASRAASAIRGIAKLIFFVVIFLAALKFLLLFL